MGIKASPTVFKLASELGIDLKNVTGTGKNNFITKKDLGDYNAANNVDAAKVTLTVSDNAQKIIAMIGNTSVTDPIINAWETCRKVRVHEGENSKGYKQRTVDFGVAHVRHCKQIHSKHFEDYSDIKTWGDMALSTTFGEIKLEARLAIIAGGFSDKMLQDRSVAGDISRWFRSEILGEEVEAPKKRGRPAKPVDPNAPVKEKRPRGRPRKNTVGNAEAGEEHPYLAMRRAREAKSEGESVYASVYASEDVEISDSEEVKDEVVQEA